MNFYSILTFIKLIITEYINNVANYIRPKFIRIVLNKNSL